MKHKVILASAFLLSSSLALADSSSNSSNVASSLNSNTGWLTGMHVGILFSHVYGQDKLSADGDSNFNNPQIIKFSGNTLGVSLGYYFNIPGSQHLVSAIEADFSGDGPSYVYTGTVSTSNTYGTQIKYSGHLRAVLGYVLSQLPAFVYIAPGLAYANTSTSLTNTSSSTINQNRLGGSLALGVGYNLGANLIAQAEAIRDIYSPVSYSNRNFGSSTYTSSLTTNTIRGSLSYRFDA